MRGLATMLWERTTLDRGIVELAISVTAQIWRSNIERVAHAPRAVEYGIPQEVLDTVLAGERLGTAADKQVVLFDVCFALHEDRELPQALYQQAVETFGEQRLFEFTGVIGFYTLVAMTLTSFAVEQDADVDVPYSRRTSPRRAAGGRSVSLRGAARWSGRGRAARRGQCVGAPCSLRSRPARSR